MGLKCPFLVCFPDWKQARGEERLDRNVETYFVQASRPLESPGSHTDWWT